MKKPVCKTIIILLALVLGGCNGTSSGTSTSSGTDTVTETDPNYAVADSEQETCYDSSVAMTCPSETDAFYGQDAQNIGSVNAQNYTDNGDQTVTDNVTGIMWTQSPDIDGIGNNDGVITSDDKLSSDNADTACSSLSHAGYSDWQLPNVKQLYSLMNFQGMDPENSADDTTYLIPFIDNDFFDFAYGSTDDERIIDSQYATTSKYYNDEGTEMMFGVNFADGRIKGYTEEFYGSDKEYFVLCMRDNSGYATNVFALTDEDTTVTDSATGLMWSRDDSGEDFSTGFDYANNLGWTSQTQDDDNDYDLVIDTDAMNGAMSWQDALAYVQQMNDENYLGYSDWRLPTIKELHTLVNYTESYNGAAIDQDYFYSTPITNENGEQDYPFYWSSTTHATDGSVYDSEGNYDSATDDYGDAGAYVAFGRALGYDSDNESEDNDWIDVHGAGAQRSEQKTWDGTDYSGGSGPQYDAVRYYHYVRLVRDAE